jgi:hypothetical protein
MLASLLLRVGYRPGDVEGDARPDDGSCLEHEAPAVDPGGTMPGPTFIAERRPDSTKWPRVVREPTPPAERTGQEPFQLDRESGGPSEVPRSGPDVRVTLFTEGGLELPLMASPAQVARLLTSVVEMATVDNGDGLPLCSKPADWRVPHPIPPAQVLRRVRVVIRPMASSEGGAS